MSKNVIIVGGICPYPQEIPDGTEVWCINAAFMKQEKVTRVYFMDDPVHFGKDVLENFNQLPEDVRIIARKNWPEVPRSEPYPINHIVERFGGITYFQCTAAYMMAHAIDEGFEQIELAGMYFIHDSMEYFHHKACMEWWLGMAAGMQIQVKIYGNTALCKSFPWASDMYGYKIQMNECLANQTLACAYRSVLAYPIRFLTDKEREDPNLMNHITNMVAVGHENHNEYFKAVHEQPHLEAVM
jgi:hypothetical protein